MDDDIQLGERIDAAVEWISAMRQLTQAIKRLQDERDAARDEAKRYRAALEKIAEYDISRDGGIDFLQPEMGQYEMWLLARSALGLGGE